MKTLITIFSLILLYPGYIEAHNHSANNPSHTVSDLHTGDLEWMNDIYYFPYEKYQSYYFRGEKETMFGDFYIVDEEQGKIYHPRTASHWWVLGESGDSFYMYGPNWEVWAYTGKYIFPWLYFSRGRDADIIHPHWGYLKHIEVRQDGELWAQMIFPFTTSGFLKRVPLPF